MCISQPINFCISNYKLVKCTSYRHHFINIYTVLHDIIKWLNILLNCTWPKKTTTYSQNGFLETMHRFVVCLSVEYNLQYLRKCVSAGQIRMYIYKHVYEYDTVMGMCVYAHLHLFIKSIIKSSLDKSYGLHRDSIAH